MLNPSPFSFSFSFSRTEGAIPSGVMFDTLAARLKRHPADVVQRQAVGYDHPDDDAPPLEWSEEEVVLLHWRLLQEVRQLADPETPLEEKFDTLRWVFTEREKDGRPFSFVNCLRVVGCSPLSPIAFCGRVDAQELRDHIRRSVKAWLGETLSRYPAWVREAIASNPAWVEARLARNPQWINEQLKQMSAHGDLFA